MFSCVVFTSQFVLILVETYSKFFYFNNDKCVQDQDDIHFVEESIPVKSLI